MQGNAAAIISIQAATISLGSRMSGNNEPEWSDRGSNLPCQKCGRMVKNLDLAGYWKNYGLWLDALFSPAVDADW